MRAGVAAVTAGQLAAVLALEDAWRPLARPDVPIIAGRVGALPYPAVPFLELLGLALAVPGLPGTPVFCDCTAGVGGKVLLAGYAGCAAWGIDPVPHYVEAARRAGADVRPGLAEQGDYAGVHIAFVNCPYRFAADEQAFEADLHAALPAGCVLIAVNHCGPPDGWLPVADEPPLWRGVYRKPGSAAPTSTS